MRFQFDPDEATCLAGNQFSLANSFSHQPSSLNLSLITKSTRPVYSSCPVSLSDFSTPQSSTMADQVSEALEVPREFVKDGVQFSKWPPIALQTIPTCPCGRC